MYNRGVVTGIRRQDQKVDALVQGVRVAADYNGQQMPWPLCEAWFAQYAPGFWYCLGPIGNRELVLHDDFLQVTTPNGDTPWTLRTSGAGGSLAASTALGVGVARVRKTAGAGVAFIHKDTDAISVPSGRNALWLSTRFRYTPDASTWFTGVSANDPPFLYACGASSDVTATTPGGGIHFGVALENATTQFRLGSYVEGTIAAVDTWYVADLLVWSGTVDGTAGNITVGWVDGNGPAGVRRMESGAITPLFGVYNDVTSDVGIDGHIDWFHIERVTLAPLAVESGDGITFP